MDQTIFDALVDAVKTEGGMVEIVVPKVGGVTASNGEVVEANRWVDGGLPVLYDAVALVLGMKGAGKLRKMLPGKDFVSNAHGNCKFMAMTADAEPLMKAAGLTEPDGGMMTLNSASHAPSFVHTCRAVRFWDRAA